MKKLLAVIVAALMLGSFAVTASAADLANYAKDATATEWVAGETEGTQTITYDLGGIKPLGYFQITWGENVPAAFTVATSSDNSSFADQYTTTDNAAAVTEIEVAAATSRYVKITITGEGSYEVKELIVRKTKDEIDTSADAKYPSSGVSIPDGSVAIKGTVIGNETGWGGNPDTGAAAAFDGDINTFFDPLGTGDGFCGMDAGKPYILTKVAIHPRDAQLARFYGATIQGSNDGEEWTDIWMSLDEATEWTWHEVEADEFDESGVAYRYYRYYNMLSHGDVAEVELYGYPEDGVVDAFPAGDAAATEATATEETTAAAETTAVEVPEMEAPVLDYPSMDNLANSGAGYATLDEAAASIGKTAVTGTTFVTGSNGNNNEGSENLWDNDTATKFCTAEFPTQSLAMFANPITVDGIIMATANDNSTYNNRSPFEWAIYVSGDGENWTAIAYGDDTFFEETDFTYYAAALSAPVEGVKYVYFQSEGALSGTFQMSEVVLTGTAGEAAAATTTETEAPVEETTAPETEAAETTATEETVEAPATTTEAPKTFDAGVIAAVAAVVSAAGYAVSKKRR